VLSVETVLQHNLGLWTYMLTKLLNCLLFIHMMILIKVMCWCDHFDNDNIVHTRNIGVPPPPPPSLPHSLSPPPPTYQSGDQCHVTMGEM
jgi:hypothetical protein